MKRLSDTAADTGIGGEGGGTAVSLQFLVDYCLSKEGAYLDTPFREMPICAKRDGRIFAEIYAKPWAGCSCIFLRGHYEPGAAPRLLVGYRLF